MATKTFKIGEYAKGGIITVETTTRTVVVIGKDWDMSQGLVEVVTKVMLKNLIEKLYH